MNILPRYKNFQFLSRIACIIIVVFSIPAFVFPSIASSLTLEEELTQVKKELESIRNNKKILESEIDKEKALQNNYDRELISLKNKINLLANKIDEKKLVIKELELEIDLLSNRLIETKTEISTAEDELTTLETETNNRLIDIYLSQKTFSDINILINPDGQADIVKFNLYHNSIQDATNSLVSSLKEKRILLEQKKVSLEEDKIAVQRDETQLQEELVALEKDEAELAAQRSTFFAKKQQSVAKVEDNSNVIIDLTADEKELDQKYNQIIAQILARGELANGFPVKTGDFLGYEGWTGYVIPADVNGRHLHFMVYSNGGFQNPCAYLPAGSYTNCGGSGELSIPIAPRGTLTSGFRSPNRPTHNAIDIAAGGGTVIAAQSGYVYFGYEACPSWAVCNNGPAIWAKVCEVNGCTSGTRTLYYHLACTSESPESSPRGCKR